MNDRRPKTRDDGKDEENPPFSRIFVVCAKNLSEDDLRGPFEKFGLIENLNVLRDRHSGGDSKGVAYIKYALTSSAAAAIQNLNHKCIAGSNKPIKVMVANQKSDKDRSINENRYVRLFIMISPSDTEETIDEHFSSFGELHSIYIIKNSGKFAYVTYNTFYDAAKAYEQCDRKYKAVFAAPKEDLKRGRDSFEHNMGSPSLSSCSLNNRDSQRFHNPSFRDDHAVVKVPYLEHRDVSQRICVTVHPQLHEKYIKSLCNIIPGLDDFQCSQDSIRGVTKAYVTYGDPSSATCAVERLNNFEFPSGEVVSVKLESNPIAQAATDISNMVNTLKSALHAGDPAFGLVQLADAIAQASSLIKDASVRPNDLEPDFCNVKLPPLQPLATTKLVAKRCFIVCRPSPPPLAVLKDAFCRFGDMIEVMTFHTKTFGFVKYASERAADEAIKTLHGATLCGATLKVMEANDRQNASDDSKRVKMDEDPESL